MRRTKVIISGFDRYAPSYVRKIPDKIITRNMSLKQMRKINDFNSKIVVYKYPKIRR